MQGLIIWKFSLCSKPVSQTANSSYTSFNDI